MSVTLNNFMVTIITLSEINKIETENGVFIALPNKTEYKLTLTSTHATRSDVTIYIDNQKIGIWRLNAHSSITIERPVHTTRKFMFVSETSDEAIKAKVAVGKHENGLIRVLFCPEREYVHLVDNVHLTSLNQQRYSTSQMNSNTLINSYSNRHNNTSYETDSINNNNHTRHSAFIMTDSITTSNNNTNHCVPTSSSFDQFTCGATVLGATSMQQFSQTTAITQYDRSNQTEINMRLIILETEVTLETESVTAVEEAVDSA